MRLANSVISWRMRSSSFDGHRFVQALRELFAIVGEHLGHARRDGRDALFHRGDAFEQDRFQFFAFARARSGEFFEHFRERRVARRAHLVERHRFGAQHAGPAQNVRRREAGDAGPRKAQLFGQRAQLLQHLDVELGGFLRGRQRVEPDPAFDLAALKLADHDLAQPGFERAQLFGQAELQIEIAMVDRPQFDVDRGGREVRASRWQNPSCCRSFCPSRQKGAG